MSRTTIYAVKAISEQRFDDKLNVLPPLNWQGIGTAAESFRISEMLDYDKVAIYVRIGSPKASRQYFELVAGDLVTHSMATAHCVTRLQATRVRS
jgi:hypothetical protein